MQSNAKQTWNGKQKRKPKQWGKKKRKRKKKIIEVKQSPEKSFEKKENEKDYS